MKRTLEALIFTAVGAIMGALAQAGADMAQEREAAQAAREYCVPLYDQPGIERVRCDPVDGAQ